MSQATGSHKDRHDTVRQYEDGSADIPTADTARRHFLMAAAAVTAAVGAGLAARPFLALLRPSAKAQAAGGPSYHQPKGGVV